jgi:hypothetical protein
LSGLHTPQALTSNGAIKSSDDREVMNNRTVPSVALKLL